MKTIDEIIKDLNLDENASKTAKQDIRAKFIDGYNTKVAPRLKTSENDPEDNLKRIASGQPAHLFDMVLMDVAYLRQLRGIYSDIYEKLTGEKLNP